jgi:hypothetical protein
MDGRYSRPANSYEGAIREGQTTGLPAAWTISTQPITRTKKKGTTGEQPDYPGEVETPPDTRRPDAEAAEEGCAPFGVTVLRSAKEH